MTLAPDLGPPTDLYAAPNPLPEPRYLQGLRYGFFPEDFFAAAQRRHGDCFTVRLPPAETWTVLADPGAIKEVFAGTPEELNSGEANLLLRPLIGVSNLLLLDGEEHITRRLMTPMPLRTERMRGHEEHIREAAAREASTWPLDRATPALPRLQALTFDIILRSVFGLEEDERFARLSFALRRALRWITDSRRALYLAFRGADRMEARRSFRRQLEAVDREIQAVIDARRAEDGSRSRDDILSLLIDARAEDGSALTDRELRDELITMLIAGHETTASMIAWALHELARSPQIQDEIARGSEGWTDAAIVETLRLRPPVAVVLRRLREPMTIDGHRLPKGATVAPCSLLVQRREDLYPDPWAFRPERFLERRPVPSEWFPFGGGHRRCIGASFSQIEARIVLGELLGRLRFSPAARVAERVGRRGPVLVPARGASVVAVKRQGGDD